MTSKWWVWLLCWVGMMCACQKVELPTEKDSSSPQESTNGTTNGTVAGDADVGGANSVEQVIEAYPNLTKDDAFSMGVVGYIVGFCDGTSISHAQFTADGAKASNLLIADSRNETDVELCMPVELKSGTDIRAELNLADHPENLGKKVWLFGNVKRYFSVTGLKDIQVYKWVEVDEDENGPNVEKPEEPTEPELPEQPDEPIVPDSPSQPDEPTPDVPITPEPPLNEETIRVEHEPIVVPGGRTTPGSSTREEKMSSRRSKATRNLVAAK